MAAPGPLAAAGPVAAAPAIIPPLPAPSTNHTFARVTIPGTESEMDYVAVQADASIIKGLPALGWVDSSAVVANTRAAPLPLHPPRV